MIIYADNREYAKKVSRESQSWKIVDDENLNIDASLLHMVIPSNKIYYSNYNISNTWKYLFITKHSDQSQYDLLYNLCKSEPELPDGLICIADSGFGFHGYRNRQWHALSGNLHLSIFKKPNQPVKNFHVGFTILAAVSVIQTLNSIKGLNNRTGIKWVNDILIENAKVSGVITQTQTQQNIVTAVILGIGLNIENAPDVQNDNIVAKSTCLLNHLERSEINFSDIFQTLLHKIDINYSLLLDGKYSELLQIYKENSIIFGKYVEIYSDTQDGSNLIIASGKVINIGNNLELFIEGFNEPITQGRLKIIS